MSSNLYSPRGLRVTGRIDADVITDGYLLLISQSVKTFSQPIASTLNCFGINSDN